MAEFDDLVADHPELHMTPTWRKVLDGAGATVGVLLVLLVAACLTALLVDATVAATRAVFG